VCGGKTEKLYFRGLKRELHLGSAITVLIESKDPRRILDRVETEIKQLPGFLRPAWAVVDKDDFAAFEGIVRGGCTVAGQPVGLAFSNPCFELWLLLHFGPWTRDCSGADIERELKTKSGFENYEHGEDVWDLVAHLRAEAMRNAEELEQRRQRDGRPEGCCPSTAVHQLMAALEQTED